MVLPAIAHKMSSYLYPSEDDIRMIGCAIAHDEQVIDAINFEINMVMAQLEKVRLRKIRYQENIRQYRSLITLARRIPPEVLADILELGTESGWTRAPLVASHVCSAWRKATAEYPRVWSRIHVDYGLGNPLTRTRLWLSGAQQSPLHIILDVPADTLSVEKILSVLFERSIQWKSVTIHTHDTTQLNHILSLMHYPFPQLRRLDCVTYLDSSMIDPVDFSAVHNAPLLYQLDIKQPNLPRWNIPFQLTNLHLFLSPTTLPNPIPTSRWVSILASQLGLKHLTLELSAESQHHYELDTTQVVILPHLESSRFIISPEFLGVFENVRASALRELFLRCSPGHEHVSFGPRLRRFLEWSPRIELLELHDVDLSREELVQCFTLLPRIEELRLHDSDISDDELQLLSGPAGLCPNLVRLDVRWCVHLTGSALVQLVRSRVQVTAEKDKSGYALQQVRELEEVAAINCLHVKERDVLDLAEYTVCRLTLRAGNDFCRNKDCCLNERYRQRMRLRHNITFHERNLSPVFARIIL